MAKSRYIKFAPNVRNSAYVGTTTLGNLRSNSWSEYEEYLVGEGAKRAFAIRLAAFQAELNDYACRDETRPRWYVALVQEWSARLLLNYEPQRRINPCTIDRAVFDAYAADARLYAWKSDRGYVVSFVGDRTRY